MEEEDWEWSLFGPNLIGSVRGQLTVNLVKSLEDHRNIVVALNAESWKGAKDILWVVKEMKEVDGNNMYFSIVDRRYTTPKAGRELILFYAAFAFTRLVILFFLCWVVDGFLFRNSRWLSCVLCWFGDDDVPTIVARFAGRSVSPKKSKTSSPLPLSTGASSPFQAAASSVGASTSFLEVATVLSSHVTSLAAQTPPESTMLVSLKEADVEKEDVSRSNLLVEMSYDTSLAVQIPP
ncbi:hypothetical protein POM88_018844 [Heracleum sosnowskyi]|uniref:Uncharacterized protein n=1 Tax=Heracleum sosnowskyi TaxID=360622 RepID=A0AAD8IS63_9APIA|nr:hypothetical protein POM88_018844 [Heracleum sosnowskyi]